MPQDLSELTKQKWGHPPTPRLAMCPPLKGTEGDPSLWELIGCCNDMWSPTRGSQCLVQSSRSPKGSWNPYFSPTGSKEVGRWKWSWLFVVFTTLGASFLWGSTYLLRVNLKTRLQSKQQSEPKWGQISWGDLTMQRKGGCIRELHQPWTPAADARNTPGTSSGSPAWGTLSTSPSAAGLGICTNPKTHLSPGCHTLCIFT